MKNMKMAGKLILSFSVIFVLLLLSTFLLLRQLNVVMDNMGYFYEHPFQVTKVARDIKSELLDMRIQAKDIILTGDPGSLNEPGISTRDGFHMYISVKMVKGSQTVNHLNHLFHSVVGIYKHG
jgi:hypothetical protein